MDSFSLLLAGNQKGVCITVKCVFIHGPVNSGGVTSVDFVLFLFLKYCILSLSLSVGRGVSLDSCVFKCYGDTELS